jgi:uncharacterized protein YceK
MTQICFQPRRREGRENRAPHGVVNLQIAITMQTKIITLLILSFMCIGCSTLATLSRRSDKYYPYAEMTNECKVYEEYGIKQQPVYSGTRNALSNVVYPFRCSGEACMGVMFYPAILPYSLIDLPFSFVADTIALPYTYNLQFNVCPNVNWAELSKKRNLLEERIRLYYSDYLNPEHVWMLSSIELKGNKSNEEFTESLQKKKYMIEYQNGSIKPQRIIINKNKAKVLMEESTHFNYRKLPWYDYWVYEDANWYIDEPNRKTE